MKYRIALATAILGVLAFTGRADATDTVLTISTTCTSYTLHVSGANFEQSAGGDVSLWGDATGSTDPTMVLRGRVTPGVTLDFVFHRTGGRSYSGGVSVHFDAGHISNRSYTVVVPACDGETTIVTEPTLPPTAPATTTTTVVCTGAPGGPPLATCPGSRSTRRARSPPRLPPQPRRSLASARTPRPPRSRSARPSRCPAPAPVSAPCRLSLPGCSPSAFSCVWPSWSAPTATPKLPPPAREEAMKKLEDFTHEAGIGEHRDGTRYCFPCETELYKAGEEFPGDDGFYETSILHAELADAAEAAALRMKGLAQ
jgi:hypothetical protein